MNTMLIFNSLSFTNSLINTSALNYNNPFAGITASVSQVSNQPDIKPILTKVPDNIKNEIIGNEERRPLGKTQISHDLAYAKQYQTGQHKRRLSRASPADYIARSSGYEDNIITDTGQILRGKHGNLGPKDGDTKLHKAIKQNFLRSSAVFSDYIEFVNIANADGETPLMLAAAGDNISLLTFLLSKVYNLNAIDVEGDTALHWAVNHGRYTAVIMLIRAGANLNVLNDVNDSPLLLAIAYTRYDMAKAFVKTCVNEEITSDLAAIAPPCNNLECNVFGNSGRSALFEAITNNALDMVEVLTEAGRTDLSLRGYDGYTPLILAACFGQTNIFRRLIGKTVDLDASNRLGETALMKSVINRHAANVMFLLRENINANLQDHRGFTAFHHAVNTGNLEMVKLVAANKNRINMRSEE